MQHSEHSVEGGQKPVMSRAELIAMIEKEIARMKAEGHGDGDSLALLEINLRVLREAEEISTRAPRRLETKVDPHQKIVDQAHKNIDALRSSHIPKCVRLMMARSHREVCREDRKRRKAA